ncbi:hypothetical protein KP77_10870 [Jeotgalibacillus alimentarius]|uniref:DUF1835 domain-containing protein n=1 Tax=Jeotgalibacillus alimentarius TaxID=135826 RepID=A0A0C2RMV6_9BACL|nr:DUF1835 domain-containing protein [Jeotgalibacillus alimentarius]KIL51575.1 hypothetical protein KP77_10870 [Jeotgalibacillus alimentarius]
MIHIIFGDSAEGSLRHALERPQIISFWDIFSVGPVWHLHEETGLESRFEWMKKITSGLYDDYRDYIKRFRKSVEKVRSIPAEEHITIWAAENAHEQTALRYVVYLLKGKNIDITVLNTTAVHKTLFDTSKVQYILRHTGEISPEKLLRICEEGTRYLLTDHDRERFEKEWGTLSASRQTLRVWRNGDIHSVPEHHLDLSFIKYAKLLHRKKDKQDFIPSARLIGKMIGEVDQHVGDSFLEYRLKELILEGVFEYKGNLENMRFYNIRLKE